ncbi:MAG: hypothetical protein OIF58_04985 [Cohaesibacter sp.]|nr:hypothetical protein [Cohaesibacter sp.]
MEEAIKHITTQIDAGARAALQHAKQGAQTEFVIEWTDKPVKSIKTGFNQICKAANLENVSPHMASTPVSLPAIYKRLQTFWTSQKSGRLNRTRKRSVILC